MQVRTHAARGIREMGFDLSKIIRSVKISVNSIITPLSCQTTLWIGERWVLSGLTFATVLGENKNINYMKPMLMLAEQKWGMLLQRLVRWRRSKRQDR